MAVEVPLIFLKYLCTRVWNSLFADTHASKIWLNECCWKTNTCRSSLWLQQILQTICMNNLRNLLQAFPVFIFQKFLRSKLILNAYKECNYWFSADALLEHFVLLSCICTNFLNPVLCNGTALLLLSLLACTWTTSLSRLFLEHSHIIVWKKRGGKCVNSFAMDSEFTCQGQCLQENKHKTHQSITTHVKKALQNHGNSFLLKKYRTWVSPFIFHRTRAEKHYEIYMFVM